jgi:hypothetical protein
MKGGVGEEGELDKNSLWKYVNRNIFVLDGRFPLHKGTELKILLLLPYHNYY